MKLLPILNIALIVFLFMLFMTQIYGLSSNIDTLNQKLRGMEDEIEDLQERIWQLENPDIELLRYKAMAEQYKKDRDICSEQVKILKEVLAK